jgi:hypothetical protein
MKRRRGRILPTALLSTIVLLTLGLTPAHAARTNFEPANTSEIEPNNTMETAQQIGVGVHVGIDAKISPARDVDFFKFAGVAGHTYVAQVYDVAAGMGDMSLYAYDSNGNTLTSTYRCNGSADVCDQIQFTASSSGEYYVQSLAVSGSITGAYSIRVLPRYGQGLKHDRDGEPDDAIALAGTIKVGVGGGLNRTLYPRSGKYFTVAGDQDFYRFTAVAGHTYMAEVYDVAAGIGDMSLYAYDADGNGLGSTYRCNGSGDVCDRVQFTAATSGSYFVQALAVSGSTSGAYSVRVLPKYDEGLTHGADGEPDDALALAEPIKVGTSQQLARTLYPRNPAYFTVAGDQDFYHFTAIAGHTYVAEVLDVAAGIGDMSLNAYDADGNGIGSTYRCNGSGNVCDRIQFTASSNGEYFLQALAVSGSVSGTYAIRVLPRYGQGLTQGRDGEPDDALALAEPIKVGVSNALDRTLYPRSAKYYTVAGDQDFYRFTGVAGDTYVAEVYDVASGIGDMSLYAYDVNGNPLASTYRCNGSGDVCDRIQFTVGSSGDYFLQTLAVSGSTSGAYSLRVLPTYDEGLTHGDDGEPNDALALSEPITVGKTASLGRSIYPRGAAYFTVAGDRDFYWFHGLAKHTYVAEVYDVASGIGDMSLYAHDVNGNPLASTYRCNGSGKVCDSIRFTVGSTGDYFLQTLAVSGSSAGDYRIRVYQTK